MKISTPLYMQRPITKLTFTNDQNLEVELKHEGNFFNIQELSALTFILHEVPCQQRGLQVLCAIWHLHHTYDPRQGVSAQFFSFFDKLTTLLHTVKTLDIPEEFETYNKVLIQKLHWIHDLYLKIATSEDFSIGNKIFSLKKLLPMKKRRLVKTIDKLIQQAEKAGIIASNEMICEQSRVLSRTYGISFSVEPCY